MLYESKDRFIDKAFAAAYGDDGIDKDYMDAVKKFANFSAADKYKIDWQQKPSTLFIAICDAYNDHTSKGGSRSQRAKANRENYKTLFEKALLEVVHTGEDTSGADLAKDDEINKRHC